MRSLVVLLALLLCSASPSAAGSDARRIVAIGNAVVEALYALGAEERIAAVDSTAIYPPRALRQKPDIGYMRQLSPEGVLSVGPDLIIADANAGPANAITVLRQSSVSYVAIPQSPSAEGVPANIRRIGEAAGLGDQAEALAEAVAEDLDRVAGDLTKLTRRPRVLFILSLAGGRMLAAGRDTGADAMIRLAGGQNVVSELSGYKQASDEAVLAAAPEVVLVVAGGRHALAAEAVFALPALANSPAAKDRHLVAMDSAFLLGFGPRTAHAAQALMRALHPDAALTPLPERDWVGERAASMP